MTPEISLFQAKKQLLQKEPFLEACMAHKNHYKIEGCNQATHCSKTGQRKH
jgi:hypothetical protein